MVRAPETIRRSIATRFLPGLLKGLAEFDAIARIAALGSPADAGRALSMSVTQALLDVGSPEAWP
jgi:hypothetical protein